MWNRGPVKGIGLEVHGCYWDLLWGCWVVIGAQRCRGLLLMESGLQAGGLGGPKMAVLIVHGEEVPTCRSRLVWRGLMLTCPGMAMAFVLVELILVNDRVWQGGVCGGRLVLMDPFCCWRWGLVWWWPGMFRGWYCWWLWYVESVWRCVRSRCGGGFVLIVSFTEVVSDWWRPVWRRFAVDVDQCCFRTFKHIWRQISDNLDAYRTYPRLIGGERICRPVSFHLPFSFASRSLVSHQTCMLLIFFQFCIAVRPLRSPCAYGCACCHVITVPAGVGVSSRDSVRSRCRVRRKEHAFCAPVGWRSVCG